VLVLYSAISSATKGLPPQVQERQDQTVQVTEVCSSGKMLCFHAQLSPL